MCLPNGIHTWSAHGAITSFDLGSFDRISSVGLVLLVSPGKKVGEQNKPAISSIALGGTRSPFAGVLLATAPLPGSEQVARPPPSLPRGRTLQLVPRPRASAAAPGEQRVLASPSSSSSPRGERSAPRSAVGHGGSSAPLPNSDRNGAELCWELSRHFAIPIFNVGQI